MSALLIIAGTDSSGGAGLTRDVAAAAAMAQATHHYCETPLLLRPVVTAVTAQTDRALRDVHPVPNEGLLAQLRAAIETGPIGAVKIGMVGSPTAAETIAHFLETELPDDCPVVLDPVLRSTSGGDLMQAADLTPLIMRADLITPNLSEAAQLAGQASASPLTDIATQARQVISLGAKAALIKGGHGTGAMSVDHLFEGDQCTAYERPRLSNGKRGTGCTLATSIAVQLLTGHSLAQACANAGDHVHTWLKAPA
ncbi:bifunctional hydroxymethylpyrimidine kinase/phosphomethylpyrimidine kinase [Phaeobacter porticola]|uniref:hydroxymethylpyrimidine kinase n=1 Tax=Phaeobacter porticola TaxID=1844006 RepID=A0A1L3I2G8_9RHOB|nr:hydroxymethylpyrimidine/phosphomethylpyrimidine kinase [Phaeobacter porticola]APG46301.1 Hydroxymethylpyrimidine/phosphomethylpyrimidine kinase [Phaeobacter porticola]